MAEDSRKPDSAEKPKPRSAEEAVYEGSRVAQAMEENRTKIIIGIVIVGALLGGFLVIRQIGIEKHLAAATAFTSASTKGDIPSLDAVVVSYPGSIPAGDALLTKANLQSNQGKQQDAQTTLEQFIRDYSSHPRYAQGLFALANVFHIAGNKEAAQSNYEKVIQVQKDGELTPLARIRLGDLALEAGDTSAAEQRYQEAFTNHPGSPFAEYAEEKIALLKVGTPKEVAKPEPPKVEAPKTEAPKTEAPKTEAPKTEAPKTEAPKTEAPKTEAPKTEAPKTEAPKTEAPKTEAPKTEAPKTEAPKTEAPKTEAPKTEA